jgi:hypothetical protein
MKRSHSLLAIAMMGLLFSGCGSGSGLQPLSGKVVVGDKPAVGAMIMFHLDGNGDMNAIPATAIAREDGTFTIATGTESGVKPGKYIATVVWPDPNVKLTDAQRMMGINPSDAPDLLKGRFATREKSTLKVEVRPGQDKLDPFDLK